MSDTDARSAGRRRPRRAPGTPDAGQQPTTRKPGLPARQAAARLLAAVIDRQVPLDGMLDSSGGNAAYRALGDADRALVRAIVMTALRRRPVIANALDGMLDKPLPEGARSLRFILEVAAAQVLFLDVPDRAAVDLAVEQAQADPRSRRFAGLVNAVLRRLSREREGLAAQCGVAVAAFPGWFGERLESIYGARTPVILAMLCEPPTIDITVKADAESWAARLGGFVLPTGSVRLVGPEGAVADLPGYAEGEWWVQDAAATIPVRLFGAMRDQRIADLCAAPGGKSAQLVHAGAEVTALDRSASRLNRLKANLARLNLSADCIETDLLQFRPAELFDAVLLDAPCSSTGTVRRHPDIPWTKSAEEIARLARLQERMLRHALTLVRPGGRLVFSNCSLDPEEGEAVVARVLADIGYVRLEPVTADMLPGLQEAIQSDGSVRTTPEMLSREPARLGGLDGFYAAMLRVEA